MQALFLPEWDVRYPKRKGTPAVNFPTHTRRPHCHTMPVCLVWFHWSGSDWGTLHATVDLWRQHRYLRLKAIAISPQPSHVLQLQFTCFPLSSIRISSSPSWCYKSPSTSFNFILNIVILLWESIPTSTDNYSNFPTINQKLELAFIYDTSTAYACFQELILGGRFCPTLPHYLSFTYI